MNIAVKPVTATTHAPLWYKETVIYQLHVKSFCDSNNDGIGDFPGLISKLDYIADLGVNTIWLLPFYPSPRRDDGYDIADYRGIHPDYGTMADFRHFVAEAHKRGLRIITELVVNHTSDQHPWFQRARRAKKGSSHRNFYVWADDDRKYPETRIIFLDSERSNWSFDPVAGQYYWHRFYSHQPDLNFDNPAVLRSVISTMRFWLKMGVDGLRLDAVPYLVEREGTNCENLPETHEILKQFRTEIDADFPDRILLAEANQWPEDAKDYFGAGDECHMAFHFPLMPRMYMAIGREDRFPITDIMRQTPQIPDNCQWAIFLRNHDELTLEMVTDFERDYLWETYAADRRARLNLGIRRRLAPLLERDRRRIELLNGLLLSMPGTPIIYYGDEIGMGDNLHLGDRDGVRTPMQWSPDRNGGFSLADPAALVLPAIMDPLYGFGTINVEAQSADPHSMLNWMRRLLAIRRQHPTFGTGTLQFLYPKNRKILCYLRESADETLLCVVNLARTPQAVEIDLSSFAGRIPVELTGGTPFPPIGQLTYLLTLPAYGFYWFHLAQSGDAPIWHMEAPEPMPEFVTLVLHGNFHDVLRTSDTRRLIESEVLPPYLAKRRWFGMKDRRIESVRLDVVTLIPAPSKRELVLAEIAVEGGDEESSWLLPLTVLWEDEQAPALPGQLALARARLHRRVGLLTDAFAMRDFALAATALMAKDSDIPSSRGTLQFRATESRRAALDQPQDAEIVWLAAEQSNSSLIIGDTVMLKLFRRVAEGEHPEAEMSRHLTGQGFAFSPQLLGEILRVGADGKRYWLAVAQAFIRNQGDAWAWIRDQLARAADNLATPDTMGVTEAELLVDCNAICAAIGRRLGEMHAILKRPSTDPAFAPETGTDKTAADLAIQIQAQLESTLNAVERKHDWEQADDAALAAQLGTLRGNLVAAIRELSRSVIDTPLTRIHGDFHLGQALVSSGEAYIIDFEGQPLRPIAERRAKASPLRDVAGLLRSIDYAAETAERDITAGKGVAAAVPDEKRHSFIEQFRLSAGQAFLDGYQAAAGPDSGLANHALLDLFLVEKAAYELGYEAANRPTWMSVPLRGLGNLARRILDAGHD